MNSNTQEKGRCAVLAKAERQPHAGDQVGIYRVYSSARGGDYFHVALMRNGKQHQKRFSFSRCGGEDLAMKLALAYRDSVVVRHPPMSMSAFCAIVRGNNTSGMPGVYRCEKAHMTKKGRNSTVYWQARIPKTDGKHRMMNFSVHALGEEEAKSRAIAARLQGLKDLENCVFRPAWQPQPVSTEVDIALLEAKLQAPAQRRESTLAKTEARRKNREERDAEKLAQAAILEQIALGNTTNTTGEPYIGRYQGAGGAGQHWLVSIVRCGVRYRKAFSDLKHGDTETALLAAKAWRDRLFLTLPRDSKATVVARVKATNTSGVSGVTRGKAERNGQIFHYWIASSPKFKGLPNKSKKYSVAKYGYEAAFELAKKARKSFVAELHNVDNFHHRAARQMRSSLEQVVDADAKLTQAADLD